MKDCKGGFEITMIIFYVSLMALEKTYKSSILYEKRIWIKQLNLILNVYPRICGKFVTAAQGLKVFLNPSLAVAKRLFPGWIIW